MPFRTLAAASIALATSLALGSACAPNRRPPQVCETHPPSKQGSAHGTELGMCPIDLPSPSADAEPLPDVAAPDSEKRSETDSETSTQPAATDARGSG